MKPSDFQKTIQCQFDCKLKKVVKGIVRNYRTITKVNIQHSMCAVQKSVYLMKNLQKH